MLNSEGFSLCLITDHHPRPVREPSAEYTARSQQRYMERQIRKYKDRLIVAQTAQQKLMARNKVREWSKALDDLIDSQPSSNYMYRHGGREKANLRLTALLKDGKIQTEIDELTPCLRDNATGKLAKTNISRISPSRSTARGWEFDWTKPERDGFEVYALRLKGQRAIQEMIALKDDPANYAVKIDIVEAAPQNNPHNPANTLKIKEYNGVGGHLFAEACRRSYDNGYGGFVYFTAKTNLIEHYTETLGAELVDPTSRLMQIQGQAAIDLIQRYYGGE